MAHARDRGPLVGLPVLLVWRSITDDAARWVGLAATLVAFAVSIGMLANFETGEAGFQMVSKHPWVESVGLNWFVGVDGFSIWLVMVTTFMFPIAIAASWKVEHQVRRYMAMALFLETVIIGAFLSLDLLLFFFEARPLLPMYYIIGVWGSKRRIYAATKFLLYDVRLRVPAGGHPVAVRRVREAARGRRSISHSSSSCSFRRVSGDGCSSRSSSASP